MPSTRGDLFFRASDSLPQPAFLILHTDLAQLNNKRLPKDELYTKKSVSRAAPHGPPFCPDVHVEFSVFDFAALGNLIWTTEQWDDDVYMNDKKNKKGGKN